MKTEWAHSNPAIVASPGENECCKATNKTRKHSMSLSQRVVYQSIKHSRKTVLQIATETGLGAGLISRSLTALIKGREAWIVGSDGIKPMSKQSRLYTSNQQIAFDFYLDGCGDLLFGDPRLANIVYSYFIEQKGINAIDKRFASCPKWLQIKEKINSIKGGAK